jgi:hypothetical protein
MSLSSLFPLYLPGHRWTSSSPPAPSSPSSATLTPPPTYTRSLGALEYKFDQATTRQNWGQSDTFVRLSISLPTSTSEEEERFIGRLTLAWAAARAKHPLLAAGVYDRDGKKVQWKGVQLREFRYTPPADERAAVEEARRTVLVHDVAEGETFEETMEEVESQWVLNGDRVLLKQEDGGMAKLVIVRTGARGKKGELGFFLVISHVVRLLPSLLLPHNP